jgi:hypothetical protein
LERRPDVTRPVTPNALKGYGPEVRIHKLDDPERNQGTISFDS